MGLDTTHDCWHASYSTFARWREAVCKAAGLGDLNDYLGFGGDLPFDSGSPLTVLLDHSDCDGEIHWSLCGPLADALEALLPKLSTDGESDWNDRAHAERWIRGLRAAASAKENVEFH